MLEPTHVLRHLGREVHVQLAGDAVVFSDASGAEARRIDLVSIRAVRLARIGTLETCELTLDDATKRTIATDEAACRAAFAAIVSGLHERLASRRVPFFAGSWLVVMIIVASCVVLGIVGLLLYLGVLDLPAFRGRGMVLAIVAALLGPIGAWTARPRALSSAAELNKRLPR